MANLTVKINKFQLSAWDISKSAEDAKISVTAEIIDSFVENDPHFRLGTRQNRQGLVQIPEKVLKSRKTKAKKALKTLFKVVS